MAGLDAAHLLQFYKAIFFCPIWMCLSHCEHEIENNRELLLQGRLWFTHTCSMSPFMVFIKKKKKKSKLTNRINYGKLAARWNGITMCFAIQGSVKVPGWKKGKIVVGL